jgi:Mg2+ and Co2+ transporter CorA
MLKKAELSHISRLNHIGRQLGVLSRLYTSYGALIDSVLEKQEASLASLKNSNIFDSNGVNSMMSSQIVHPTTVEMLGVSLSSASRVRFERLKHRINIYALSELQDCISQKDSLVMMNFNLIAIKESYSVERLTRVTLLLAKVTMLFMPVSLMTAYFSCQLQDVDFTVRSYWTWFAVILSISVAGLVVFSAVSGTMEGSMNVGSWSRKIWIAIKGRDPAIEEQE